MLERLLATSGSTYKTVLDILFPPRCVVCNAAGEWFCATCRRKIIPLTRPWCPRCHLALPTETLCETCRGADVALDGLIAVGVHDGVLRTTIHAYKYDNRPPLAAILSSLIVEAMKRDIFAATLVMPVPSHPRRIAQRGYDHTHLLASRVAAGLGLPYDNKSLSRVRFTPPQVGMTAKERHANVANAFGVTPLSDHRRILLVDDVYTSGSTMRACAKELLANGADAVIAAVVARA
ncbi:MAG: ComF family protein [Anaerolineae bacterium]